MHDARDARTGNKSHICLKKNNIKPLRLCHITTLINNGPTHLMTHYLPLTSNSSKHLLGGSCDCLHCLKVNLCNILKHVSSACAHKETERLWPVAPFCLRQTSSTCPHGVCGKLRPPALTHTHTHTPPAASSGGWTTCCGRCQKPCCIKMSD